MLAGATDQYCREERHRLNCCKVLQNAACSEFHLVWVNIAAMARELRNHRVSVGLTANEKRILERLADKSGLSVSRVAQEAVSEFIASAKEDGLEIIRKPEIGKPKGK